MLIVNITILALFFTGLMICKNKEAVSQPQDRKNHTLYYLYPMADYILRITGLYRLLNRKEAISNFIKALYLTNKPEEQLKLYWCSKVSLIIMIIVLFNLLSILGQLTPNSTNLTEGRYLSRPNAGEGNKQVELKVTIEDRENANSTEGTPIDSTQEIKINVAERNYKQEEVEQLFKEGKEYIAVAVLGNNQTKDEIYEKLHFIKILPGTSIKVEWEPENRDLIDKDGTIHNENMSKDGIATSVTATLSYLDYKSECVLDFRIIPKYLSEEELLLEKLEGEIAAASQRTAEDLRLELPLTLDNYKLSWGGKENNNGLILLLLGILASFLVWLNGDRQLNHQMERRKNQMLLDYPEIINKFTLLVNAGMTVKQAWSRISDDYSVKLHRKHLTKRYAYEEMITTCRELKLGVPEGTAYEQYGRRVGLIPYIKFSSLISQNLRKGNKGFTDLLIQVADEAFEDRKEAVKRLGEEAGAKLLMPMMIMLVIVFLIILIPAFMSF